MHRRGVRAFALALFLALYTTSVTFAASLGPWQDVKAATAPYHSLAQAVAAGYSIDGEPCVVSPDGGMGIHAVNRSLAGDLTIDPLRPEILLYEPDADGALKLVGVEYFEVALANSDEGPIPWFGANEPDAGWFNPAPSVLGQKFDGPMPGHNPFMPWHYDQHIWLWTDSPAGMFAIWNPAVSCPGG